LTDTTSLLRHLFHRLPDAVAVLAVAALIGEIVWLWRASPIDLAEHRIVAVTLPLPAPATPLPTLVPAPQPAPEPALAAATPPSAPPEEPRPAMRASDVARLNRMLAAASSAGPVRARRKLPALAAPAAAAGMKSLAAFRDCEQCPLMVVLPPGRFRMGSIDGNSWEMPRHAVSIGRRYAMARFEITERQWQACVADGYCAEHAGNNVKLPVTKVRWQDTHDYVEWLSDKTGRSYRLPSEAEWAYAVRGGSNASRFWGPDRQNQCLYANGADQALKKTSAKAAIAFVDCDDRYPRRAPVGSYKPNAFGLRDMAGNVWEWVQDCWTENYSGAPTDGSAVSRKACNEFVIRGGSWRMRPEALRSSERGRALASQRSDDLGFRVAAD